MRKVRASWSSAGTTGIGCQTSLQIFPQLEDLLLLPSGGRPGTCVRLGATIHRGSGQAETKPAKASNRSRSWCGYRSNMVQRKNNNFIQLVSLNSSATKKHNNEEMTNIYQWPKAAHFDRKLPADKLGPVLGTVLGFRLLIPARRQVPPDLGWKGWTVYRTGSSRGNPSMNQLPG